MIGRWHNQLAPFNFKIVHRKGEIHLNADALSRIPPRRCPREDCPHCYPSTDNIDLNLLGLIDQGYQECRREYHDATTEATVRSHVVDLDNVSI